MKTLKIVALLMIAAVAALAVRSVTPAFQKHPTIRQMVNGIGDYPKLWAKTDSLLSKGLTRSALEVVAVIYNKAKAENNVGNFVKSVTYRLRLESYISDDDFAKEIGALTDEISTAKYPVKPVLQTMLAQVYWQYYQANRYRFLNRTETVDYVPADIRTWDLRKIVEKVIQNYMESLSNSDSLKKTAINLYDDILIQQPDSRKFRPTLYDFLAHRALDFFINEEPGLIAPADKFEMDNPICFEPYYLFSKENFTSRDNYSLNYYAILIFQDLLNFHAGDADPAALIDADIKRLKFARQKSVLENKDSLYVLALESLEKRFITFPSSADATYEIASYYYQESVNYTGTRNPAQRWLALKAYNICDQAIKRHPESYGARNCQYLRLRITEKAMSLTTEEVTDAMKPFRAMVSYKNLSKVYIRVIPVDPEWNENLISGNYYQDKIIKEYLKIKPLKEFSQEFTDPGDYQNHSTEIIIPELPSGFYTILMGSSADFSTERQAVSYGNFWVSDMAYLKRTLASGNVEFVITHRDKGIPLQGVTAQVFRQVYNYTTRKYEYRTGPRYTSDANGCFQVSPGNNNYDNFYVELSLGKDKLNSEAFYQYKPYASDRKMYNRTVFFTDRAIYRPGQTVYFKGIVLATDGENSEIKPMTKTNVVFYDVNYQKIIEKEFTTNEYGTFNGSFVIPVGLLNGQMHLADAWGSIYFSVEEYKRPRFEVRFDPVKGNYRLGDKVKAEGTAVSYSGANVDNAQVKYRVVRTATFPWWWWYWYGYYPTSPQMEITNGSTTTDQNGKFSIDFQAIPDRKVARESEPTFSYTIYADVTDINGETRSSQTIVKAGYKSLIVGVDIPAEIEKSNKGPFTINTTNLNGNSVHAKGSIVIHRLKQPQKIFRERRWTEPDIKLIPKDQYYSIFPYDLYDNELNTASWEKEQKVYETGFDTGRDSLLIPDNMKSWPSGAYVLEISSTDPFGEKVKSFSYFTLYSNDDKMIPLNQTDWFSAVKTSGEPGEDAIFRIGSREKDVKVLVETEIRNTIVSREWITLNNEMREIRIPIAENCRGNFSVHFTLIRHGRVYRHDVNIEVPYTNRELDISFSTFRNKLLPGQKEEWTLTIKGKNGDKVAAEMLATMYDASLDAFRNNTWLFQLLRYYYAQRNWESDGGFSTMTTSVYGVEWNPYSYLTPRYYDMLNWFGFAMYSYYGYYYDDADYGSYDGTVMEAEVVTQTRYRAPMAASGVTREAKKGGEKSLETTATGGIVAGDALENQDKRDENKSAPGKENMNGLRDQTGEGFGDVKIRSNFSETAFFLPELRTNDKGEVVVAFTVPEALTKWKFMGFAHTRDLRYGQIQREVITQKDLMVVSNGPRFFRENDSIVFPAKVTNLSDKNLSAQTTLQLINAETGQPIDLLCGNSDQVKCFDIPAGQSRAAEWKIFIPEGLSAITYRVISRAGNFSDGEEMLAPVLTNRMLVTETMPLPIRGIQTRDFRLEKLIEAAKSGTLKNYKLTLEFTSNPAWYAVQALPYLIEYPYECTEQIFSRFYANSIATHIANSSPKIREVFESWRKETPDALLSNLEKNQDLKYVMLQETPWVLQAKNETQRKQNVGILFETERMQREIDKALRKLEKLQVSNGGWTWFPGMPDDRYITQHIVTGMGHLDKLGVRDIKESQRVWKMVRRGVLYLDDRIREDYEWLLRYYPDKMHLNHLGGIQIQYLYARSYFLKEVSVEQKNRKAVDYYTGQAKKFWLQNNRYLQGMIALALNRLGDENTPADIIKSLRENAIFSEEMGMYWKNMDYGYYWYQAPVETQALLIECFDEVANDRKSVEDMKVWLLKQKQTQDWKTTRATTEACYALLMRGSDWLSRDPEVSISLGNMLIDPEKLPDVKVQAGTGYFRTSWYNEAITPDMGKVKISKKEEGVAWGALYWQYFEQLDKITMAETPVKIDKKLFVEKNSGHGPVIQPVTENSVLKPGDKIKVRIEIRVDRDMEYVHMKDMRASGFEPVNVISQYKYQGGLGYYESTGDAATNFFISYLKKGTYVFEYPLRVAQKGNFSNGITTIQCMYAPEFTAHSEGIRVRVSG